jgi:hypothetical protein
MKNRRQKKHRANLPEVIQTSGMTIAIRNQKIPLQEIHRSLKHCVDLVDAYNQRVLSQKTRTIRLLGRKCSAKILNTLLGFEVQASYKRIQCPDLVTARYLRLFSELGCHSIRLPYDPTLTAQLIPEFEAMVDAIRKQIGELFPRDSATKHYVVRKVYGKIRQQLRACKIPAGSSFQPEQFESDF